MGARQLRGSADAITSFACAACSASASSAGADAATALMDDASAFPAGEHGVSGGAVTRALNRVSIVGAPVREKVPGEYSVWTADMDQDFVAGEDALKSQLLKEWKYPVEWR